MHFCSIANSSSVSSKMRNKWKKWECSTEVTMFVTLNRLSSKSALWLSTLCRIPLYHPKCWKERPMCTSCCPETKYTKVSFEQHRFRLSNLWFRTFGQFVPKTMCKWTALCNKRSQWMENADNFRSASEFWVEALCPSKAAFLSKKKCSVSLSISKKANPPISMSAKNAVWNGFARTVLCTVTVDTNANCRLWDIDLIGRSVTAPPNVTADLSTKCQR